MEKSESLLKKKKAGLWNTVYYLVAGLILAVTLIAALRGKTVNSSDAFGTTTDAKLEFEENMEIRTDFKIRRNHFKGINFKFHVTQRVEYGNDTVVFYLRDNSTGEIVSRYELLMKNTLPQVGNFIPLAFDDSEGKDVSLFIVGKNIKAKIYLPMSAREKNESELYVGNIHRRLYALIFTCVYQERQLINFEALIKGSIFFFMWILVGLWQTLFHRAQKTAVSPEDSSENKNKLTEFSRALFMKYKKALLFLMTVVLFLFLSVFVYKNNIEPLLLQENPIEIVHCPDPVYENESIVMDSSDDILTETFTAQEDYLSSLSFQVAAPKADSRAMLHVGVTNVEKDLSYYDRYIHVSSLPSSKSVWKFYLENEFAKSAGKTFEIRIEPVNFSSSEVHFYIGEARSAAKSLFGNRRTGKLPLLTASYSDYYFLRTLYLAFSILIFLFLVMCFYMIVVRKWNAQRIYIPFCLFLGILYMLIIPVYSVPDEYAHIDTAYNLSNRLMGIEKPEEYVGYDYRRETDIRTEEYYTYYTTTDDYRRIYTELFTHVPAQELVPCVTRATDSNVDPLYFLPSALGIVLGRILRLSTTPMYLLGRLFNLIAYVLITYLAIRKLQGLKEVFLIYATLPIGLQQAASFSYDCILNAIALLFFSYCVYFALDKGVPGKMDVILLLLTSLQMAAVKGGVYVFLCVFLLLIPLERRWDWPKNKAFFLLFGGFLCFGFLQRNTTSLLNRLLPGSTGNVSMFSGKAVYTFSDLISHPLRVIRLYGNTFFQEGSRLVYEFFGGKMGSLQDIQMPWLYSCAFMFILGSVIYKSRNNLSLRHISKVLCGVGTIPSVLLVGAAMLLAHTPKTSLYITGLQGRYFIPIMLFPILCLVNTSEAGEETQKNRNRTVSSVRKLLMWNCIIHIAFIFNIIMVLISAIPSV